MSGEQPSKQPSSRLKGGRVLLVDDEAVILRTLTRALELSGHQVTAVADGREAFSILQEQPPFEVVITDLTLQNGSGLEVLQRAKVKDPDTAVVVMTGFSAESSPLEALRLGAEEYLAKPFDFGELLLRVSRCLERRKLARKVRLYERLLGVCPACGRMPDPSGDWVRPEELAASAAPEPRSCRECQPKVLSPKS